MSPRSAGAGRRHLGLRHLEYFVAVVEHGSMAAAAESLFVASSGVSQTIAELEARLGTTLLERSRAGSRPTAAGQVLLESARRTLRAFDEATLPDDSTASVPSSLAVLSTPSLLQEPTARLIGALHQRMSGVRITLTEPTGAFVSDAVQPVLAGTVDVAVTEHPEGLLPNARVVRIPDQLIRLVCPPGTPAPRDGVFEASDLLSIGLVVAPLFESSDVYRGMRAIEPRIHEAIVVRTEHRDALMTLARAGAGAVLLDRGRAERAAQLGCVVGDIAGLPLRRVSAVARADRTSPALEEFLRLCARRPES